MTWNDCIVVVTGASSGLGREVAVQFAERGCALVLAARRLEALEQTAQMCTAAGAPALVVVTDVTREEDVLRLAEAALATFGRIDVWVNNAGVTLFAPLDGVPFEAHRRVLETNLFGAMFAARAVMPIFQEQRQGVMINVGSVLSKIGQPFVPSYTISKFALRGLSEALRVEVADEPDIHVCTVFPYAIDTPHFETGGNAIGLEPHGMPPVQSAAKVARAIVELAEHPKRERHVPRVAVLGLAAHWLWPRTTERLLLRALRAWHFANRPEPATTGNLYEAPDGGSSVRGHRLPRLTGAALASWAVRELVKIEGEALRRHWPRRARAPGAAATAVV